MGRFLFCLTRQREAVDQTKRGCVPQPATCIAGAVLWTQEGRGGLPEGKTAARLRRRSERRAAALWRRFHFGEDQSFGVSSKEIEDPGDDPAASGRSAQARATRTT